MKKHRAMSRIIAAALLAVVLGCLMNGYYVKRGEMGREAFIAYQMKRYDRYFSHPRPVIRIVLTSVIVFGGIFAIYEGAAYAIYRLLRSTSADDTSSKPSSAANAAPPHR